jgi:hypothetical protein
MEQIKHAIRIDPNRPALRWRIGMITHRINEASLGGILHPHCARLAALAVRSALQRGLLLAVHGGRRRPALLTRSGRTALSCSIDSSSAVLGLAGPRALRGGDFLEYGVLGILTGGIAG